MRVSAMDTAAIVLAQAPPPGNPGGQGEDFGKSSPVGLVLLILFAIAIGFLVRSMTKHLKKLPVLFDEQKAASAAPERAKRAERAREAAERDRADADAVESDAQDPDSERPDSSSGSNSGSTSPKSAT